MDAREALKIYFGYDSFKPGQEDIIGSVLAGRDVLAIMPTGAGKSVCYQVPAMLLPGITVVISPLISLMQDQVKALKAAGIRAGYINSSLTEAQIARVYAQARQGAYKLLYVAPERLESYDFTSFAAQAEISMVTVDEAHCISQWGQDFRPSYLKIVAFIEALRIRPVVSAFTATATEEVKNDISCVLKLQNPKTVVTGFDRENLWFDVQAMKQKDNYVLDFVKKHPDDSGIIYCATRKNVDALHALLQGAGVPAARYHAGMTPEDRKKNQDDFIYDRTPVIVATNAFGMGIDKSNVRYVLHYNMPQSMENYYQEAGRAGRDGAPSRCILLFSAQDIMINRFLLEHKNFTDVAEEDIELIKARDAKRLQVMEGYCRTSGCLRNYILSYFGEKRDAPCGSCGNCQREFTQIDMTEDAKQVINCVYETKGRYGLNILLGTLLGANRARLKELGTTEYRTYGVLKNRSEAELRTLIGQLLLDGYLVQTADRYSVIRMGNIEPLRQPDTRVTILTYKEKEAERQGTKQSRRSTDVLTKAGYELFDLLRKLRLAVAKEEAVPPYIIFSDKTLIDMSAKAPQNRDAMLRVSGVGEIKFDKYGERFIDAIVGFLKDRPNAVTSIADPEAGGAEMERSAKKAKKVPFYLNPEDVERFRYHDLYSVMEIKDELNRISSADNVKLLFGTDIFRFLSSVGYVEEKRINGRQVQLCTEKGISKGIVSADRISKTGTVYQILMYPPTVQKEIVAHYASLNGADAQPQIVRKDVDK